MITSIGDVLSGLPVNNRVKEYGLWKAWDKVVGSQVSTHCQPDRLKDGILFLKVSSSSWMQQLQFMKSMIIEKVNVFMKEEMVRDIRFQIGKLGVVRRENGRPWLEVNLPREILMKIDGDLSSVKDGELKEIIKKLRIKEAKVKTWEGQGDKGGSSKIAPE